MQTGRRLSLWTTLNCRQRTQTPSETPEDWNSHSAREGGEGGRGGREEGREGGREGGKESGRKKEQRGGRERGRRGKEDGTKEGAKGRREKIQMYIHVNVCSLKAGSQYDAEPCVVLRHDALRNCEHCVMVKMRRNATQRERTEE